MIAPLKETVELVELFHQEGRRHRYAKGDFIIRAGEPAPGVFYISSGLVKAYDITKYHEENLLIIRREDEIFPLIWAITGQERDVIYQALSPVEACMISRAKFIQYLNSHPAALAPLLDMAIEMYRLHSERILNLEYRTVRERIVSFLLLMSERFGNSSDEGIAISAPLRHQDIASSINASRETTSREMSVLEKKGFIKNRQGLITLCEPAALRKLLG